MSDEANFELLLECYLSNQMSERQWQDHLRLDHGLKEWYEDYKARKKAVIEGKFDKLKTTGSV